MVIKGDSSIGGDGFDISLVVVDGGMHFARRGKQHQGGIEGTVEGVVMMGVGKRVKSRRKAKFVSYL